MTEPNDIAERIEQLHARLSPKGKLFFEEYERRREAVRQSGSTDLGSMADQAWLTEQLPTLSPSDLEIVMAAMQLQTLHVFGTTSGQETIELMVKDAQKDPDRARDMIAQAHQLQLYKGEPVNPDMNFDEAVEVLQRLLFDPDV